MATIDIYVFSIARSVKISIWNYMSKTFVYWYKSCLWCLKTTKRRFLCKIWRRWAIWHSLVTEK